MNTPTGRSRKVVLEAEKKVGTIFLMKPNIFRQKIIGIQPFGKTEISYNGFENFIHAFIFTHSRESLILRPRGGASIGYYRARTPRPGSTLKARDLSLPRSSSRAPRTFRSVFQSAFLSTGSSLSPFSFLLISHFSKKNASKTESHETRYREFAF